ncbi:putative leader peptide [Streptomyces sp. NPDC048018]
MKTAVRLPDAVSTPLVARLHVDLCRCTSAVCCRSL